MFPQKKNFVIKVFNAQSITTNNKYQRICTKIKDNIQQLCLIFTLFLQTSNTSLVLPKSYLSFL